MRSAEAEHKQHSKRGGTHFDSGPIGMFCRIIFFYSIRLFPPPLANMGLALQYINPIEVLQDQYKGWKSRRYHIQIVGFTKTTRQ